MDRWLRSAQELRRRNERARAKRFVIGMWRDNEQLLADGQLSRDSLGHEPQDGSPNAVNVPAQSKHQGGFRESPKRPERSD